MGLTLTLLGSIYSSTIALYFLECVIGGTLLIQETPLYALTTSKQVYILQYALCPIKV